MDLLMLPMKVCKVGSFYNGYSCCYGCVGGSLLARNEQLNFIHVRNVLLCTIKVRQAHELLHSQALGRIRMQAGPHDLHGIVRQVGEPAVAVYGRDINKEGSAR
jgi:hypothetical protein